MADGSIKSMALIAATCAFGAAYVASDPARMKQAMDLVNGWTANAAVGAPQSPKPEPLFPSAPPPNPPRQTAALSKNVGYGVVELQADGVGQFHSEVMLEDTPFQMMVDTGATLVSLSYEDAERLNHPLKSEDFKYTSQTANGATRVAMIVLREVQIGTISVRNVQALVSAPGVQTPPLLGMSFLKSLSVGAENGKLVLKQ